MRGRKPKRGLGQPSTATDKGWRPGSREWVCAAGHPAWSTTAWGRVNGEAVRAESPRFKHTLVYVAGRRGRLTPVPGEDAEQAIAEHEHHDRWTQGVCEK